MEGSWRLVEGAEWKRHCLQVDANLNRFEDNFRSARWVLERDPYAFSEALLADDPEQRVFATRDFLEGYELVVFLQLDPDAKTCELVWVKLRPLTPDETVWGI